MNQISLSLDDPNTLLPHRAGMAGLGLALLSLQADDAPLSWRVLPRTIDVSWHGSARDALGWLFRQVYRSKNGYIEARPLNFNDEQSHYIFTDAIVSSFLQHGQTRKRLAEETRTFHLDEFDKPLTIPFKPLESFFYMKEEKVLDPFLDAKGRFKKKVNLKSHIFPGLVEDFANGCYQESPELYFALCFLPLACTYYSLPNYKLALIVPEVTDVVTWSRRRQRFPKRTLQDYQACGLGESALRFLSAEKLASDGQLFGIQRFEVFQLGTQKWNEKQKLKQDVYQIVPNEIDLNLYEAARDHFPARQVQVKTKKGEPERYWLAPSRPLGWLTENILSKTHWYRGFADYRKRYGVYPDDRKGLQYMTEEYLCLEERILFESVQGAYRTFLWQQAQAAAQQGRNLDGESWARIAKKFIYRLQRPATRQDFSSALVHILTQYPSPAAKDHGKEIYGWLHHQKNWRQAKDLSLLAVATYKGKEKNDVAAPATSELTPEIVE